ncbi:MAG: hypothetical protein ABSH20_12350 [Tepidisphaeraceae bacterium]|jgi:hypothetical protein
MLHGLLHIIAMLAGDRRMPTLLAPLIGMVAGVGVVFLASFEHDVPGWMFGLLAGIGFVGGCVVLAMDLWRRDV